MKEWEKKESFDHYYDIEKKTFESQGKNNIKQKFILIYISILLHISCRLNYIYIQEERLFALYDLIVDLFILSFLFRSKKREKKK